MTRIMSKKAAMPIEEKPIFFIPVYNAEEVKTLLHAFNLAEDILRVGKWPLALQSILRFKGRIMGRCIENGYLVDATPGHVMVTRRSAFHRKGVIL